MTTTTQNIYTIITGSTQNEASAAIESIWLLSQRGRRVSINLLRAFAKRATTVALSTQHHCAIALLSLLRLLLRHLPPGSLLEDDLEEAIRYQPLLESPEHSGASGARILELVALKRHYHVGVRQAASSLLNANGSFPTDFGDL